MRNLLKFFKEEWKFLTKAILLCSFTITVAICVIHAIFTLWNVV